MLQRLTNVHGSGSDLRLGATSPAAFRSASAGRPAAMPDRPFRDDFNRTDIVFTAASIVWCLVGLA